MQTIDLVKKIVEALEDKKAEDITVLDIGEVSSIADYFIMDYQDIIVHLFSKEDRQFYDLDRIWRDGKVVDVHSL